MSDLFPDTMTLGKARDVLRTLVDEGHRCPTCSQLAKVYERSIHATMARELIRLYRQAPAARVGHDGTDWFHLPTLLGHNGGDVTKCRYWGLLEEDDRQREDGGRAGFWRLTGLGVDFVLERVTVSKTARVYDGRLLGLGGLQVGIRDCLGTRFDYSELMRPASPTDDAGDPLLFRPPAELGDAA